MRSTARWVRDHLSVVDNGREHAVVLDLPPGKNGSDLGATALELSLMALSGCLSTIYTVVAARMRLSLESLEVVLDAEKPEDAPAITRVQGTIQVTSSEEEKKLQRCLELTLDGCPVGKMFQQAGVELELELVASEEEPASVGV